MVAFRNVIKLVFVVGLFAVLSISGNAAPLMERGPYLQMAGPDTMTVRWRTSEAASSIIHFGTSQGSLTFSSSSAGLTTEHELHITEESGGIPLSADTKYFYQIGYDDGGGFTALAGGDSSHFFTTSPPEGQNVPTRIWIIGDSGTANSNAYNVRDAFKSYDGGAGADLWIMLGDNAYNDGTDAEYTNAVFNTYPEILRHTPLWPTLGNHDGHTADSATQTGPYYDSFTLPTNSELGSGASSGTEAYYSFDYGDIHFISLESYETDRSVGGAMMQWLEADIQASDKKWIIAFWHHPPYTKGSHNSDTESQLIQMRENALPILEQYGVDIVLSGHSHSYERSYLLDGHYGLSGTLTIDMTLDDGDGDPSGDGSYQKPQGGGVANGGAVYAVAGSSGKVSSSGSLDHAAMQISLASLGSMVLDIDGDQLDAIFLDGSGAILDTFRISKAPDVTAPIVVSGDVLSDTEILVQMSEALNVSGEIPGNYTVDNGVAVLSVSFDCKASQVLLETSPLAIGSSYLVTANNIEDLAGNQIAGSNTASATFIETVTRTMQDGLSPTSCYDGTRDSYISEEPLPGGADPGHETSLLADGSDPNGTDKKALMKWNLDNAHLPPSVEVESAAIIINVTNETSQAYELYGLNRAWDEYQTSWANAANGDAWSVAGANGSSDYDATVIGGITSAAVGSKTINLNAAGIALVQNWLDDPANNHGVILWNTDSTNGLDFSSREAGPTTRPALRITYRVLAGGGGDTTDPTWPGGNAGLQLVSKSDSNILFSWNAADDDTGIAGYRVYRDDVLHDTIGSITSYDDTGLTPDQSYSYYVVAFDAVGNSSVASADLVVQTDPAVAAAVHIGDIAMALKPASKKGAKAEATVTILDHNDQPVVGADIDGEWSGIVSGNETRTTDAAGLTTFTSPSVGRNEVGNFQFVVTDVRHSGSNYDSDANIGNDGCIERLSAGSTNSQDCTITPPPPTPDEVVATVSTAVTLSRKGKNWRATATIDVVATPGGALANAEVVGRWSILGGSDLGTTSATTDSGGQSQLTSPSTKLGAGEQLCLLVENVITSGTGFAQTTPQTCGNQ